MINLCGSFLFNKAKFRPDKRQLLTLFDNVLTIEGRSSQLTQ